jgi:formylglycine-generating enzyme required for sulfatase activity
MCPFVGGCHQPNANIQTPPNLPGYSFTTCLLDKEGNEVSQSKHQATLYVENLGNEVNLELVEIKSGKCQIGISSREIEIIEQTTNQKNLIPLELPRQEITVPPFFIGKCEITQAQWRIVAGYPKVENDLEPIPLGIQKGMDNLPITNLDRVDAEEFCKRLSKRTGKKYRLPTENEWEYACRAGTQTPFAFGETITTKLGNFAGDYPYGQTPKGENRGQLVPVDSLGLANAFGLYDMHGNVFEWCSENWKPNRLNEPAPQYIRPLGVIRGGSFRTGAVGCRSSSRFMKISIMSDTRAKELEYGDIGFRVVLEPSSN